MKPQSRRERVAVRGLEVVAIHIRVKFACRLHLEFQQQAATVRSQEVRIDPTQTVYPLRQQILLEGEEPLLVFVKLLSSKGLAFTAGTMCVDRRLPLQDHFTLPISKTQDIEAHCDCQLLSSPPLTPPLSPKTHSPPHRTAVSMREQPREAEVLRGRVRELEVELSSLRLSHQQLKVKFSQLGCSPSPTPNSPDRKAKIREAAWAELQRREGELTARVQQLQCELLESKSMLQQQKEVIQLLETKQAEATQERTLSKATLRQLEQQHDQKRERLRALEGQKVALIMAALNAQKQHTAYRQKVNEILTTALENITRGCRERWQRIERLGEEQEGSAGLVEAKLEESALKMTGHRLFSQADQVWGEESLAHPENSPSQMHDISISHIQTPTKQTDPIRKLVVKLERTVAQWGERACRRAGEWAQQARSLRARLKVHREEFDSNEQSVMVYLQELERGMEEQLALAAQREDRLAKSETTIQQLRDAQADRENLIAQLERHTHQLETDRDEVRAELHENNYAHATREEQLLKQIYLLQHGELPSPTPSATSSTRNRKRRKEAPPHWELEVAEWKQRVREAELALEWEREEAGRQLQEKDQQLRTALTEQRRLEMAMRLRERMQVLNESIQLSFEEEKELMETAS